jgi:hypothetical protein
VSLPRVACLVVSLAGLCLPAFGGEQAVIAGTVFRDPGFALPRAEVLVTPSETPAGPKKKKVKPRKAVTDGRGEFAVYVPAEKGSYVVSVKAEGLEPQRKPVEISGAPGERVDVYLTLKPATGGQSKQ